MISWCVQPYTAGTAVSVSIKGIWESVQTTQHCTASTPTGRPYMQLGRGWGSRSRGICVGDREISN